MFVARNTTPAQRFKWLMDMLDLLRPQMPRLLKNRELLEAKRRVRENPDTPQEEEKIGRN